MNRDKKPGEWAYPFIFFILACLLFHPSLYSQEKTLDELLRLNLEDLMAIPIVTATKKPQSLENVPGTVRVLTADQIRENGYFTLEEALSDIPGFQFRNIMGFNSYIFQRGIPSQNNLMLILIDGIQINELNSGGFYGGAQYNLDNIERIEIVCGPASALYGTNAVSGVINLITRDPQKIQGVRINGLFGSFGTYGTHFSIGYRRDDHPVSFIISGMAKKSEKADLAGAEGDDNWTENMENFEDDYALDTKVYYKNFTLGINYQNKQSSRSTLYRSVDSIYRDQGTLWNIRFINSYLKHSISFGKKTHVDSRFYYRDASVLDNTVGLITDTTQVGYFRPNQLFGWESILNYTPNRRLDFIGGIVFERESLADFFSQTYSSSPDQPPPRPPKPSSQTNSLLSLYLQAQIDVFPGMHLISGARFDNSSYYDQVLTPRLGLIYRYKRWTSKLMYAEAFRAPRPWDYTDGLGNPGLDPEEMQSLELSSSFFPVDRFRFDISVYHNRLHNVFFKEFTGEEWRWINFGRLDTNGIELEAQYKKDRWTSYFNYTYTRSTDSESVPVPEIAEHTLNLGLAYTISKNIKLNLRGNYLGPRKTLGIIPDAGDRNIKAAFIFHGSLSLFNFRNFDLQILIKNLLDSEYYHSSNNLPARYRQPQRTLMLKLGLRI